MAEKARDRLLDRGEGNTSPSAGAPLLPAPGQDLERERVEPELMRVAILGQPAGLAPDPVVEVKVLPTEIGDLVAARRRRDGEAHEIAEDQLERRLASRPDQRQVPERGRALALASCGRPVGAANRSAGIDHDPVFVHGPIEKSIEGAETVPIRLALLKLAHCPDVDACERGRRYSERGDGAAKVIGLLFRPCSRDTARRPSSPSSAGRRGNPRPRAPPWRRAGTPFRRSRPCGLRPGLHQLQQRP